jgi:hypothetical protein
VAGSGGSKLETDLNSYEEVPALSTPGVGEFQARINRSEDEISYRLTFDDLESPVLQAHIHFENATNTGPIIAFLCTNVGGAPAGTTPPPCPPGGGTVDGELDEDDVGPGAAAQGLEAENFEEFVAALRSGATYVNVHSDTRRTGEIRGQLDDDHRGHGDD